MEAVVTHRAPHSCVPPFKPESLRDLWVCPDCKMKWTAVPAEKELIAELVSPGTYVWKGVRHGI